MRIVEISYGRFPEIDNLNTRFKPGRMRLKVVLDVFAPKQRVDFRELYGKLKMIFPNLKKHKCCESWIHKDDIPLKSIGGSADIAHLVEHLIIDLHSTVALMRSCSGVTCAYKNPQHRFDLFVESKDPRVGRFSANFALFLVHQLILGKVAIVKHLKIIQLAKYLYQNPQALLHLDGLAKRLKWSKKTFDTTLRELVRFQFLTQKDLEFKGKEKKT